MGVVWKAEDTILGRAVAIKVLPAESALDETRRRMFTDEARLASSLSDGHIAQVHELGHHDGLDFIVMEYVEGKPLSSLARGRALPVEQVVRLGHQVAQALSRAHRKGLLHRDLKPANIPEP
jgi:eukaryotic-like serine/threonine-protein kinase